jgi:putative flippase GtrA
MAEEVSLPQPVELPLRDAPGAGAPVADRPDGSGPLDLRTQLVRFVLTGGLSAVVDFGLLVALMAAGLGHTPAKALSFVAGTTTAYLINRRWTFRAEPSRRRFAAVVVLYAVTFALQVGLFSLLFTTLTRSGLGELAVQVGAFVVAQGAATTVNFVVQRTLIFRLR